MLGHARADSEHSDLLSMHRMSRRIRSSQDARYSRENHRRDFLDVDGSGCLGSSESR